MVAPAPHSDDAMAFKRVLQIALVIGIGAVSILFFFQTRDPMILIFGTIAAAILWVATSIRSRGRSWGVQEIRVKCRSCGALNLENAKYCSACGKAL